MVTGKKSHIYLDNPFNLTEHILDNIYLYGIIGAKNGLNIQSVLSGSGVSTNYVALGGTLDSNTTISGAAFNLTLTNIGTLALSSNSFQLVASSAFNLRTPNVVASTAVTGQYLRLTNQVSGACDWDDLPPTKYVEDFLVADWSSQRIIVTAATHGMGTQPTVQVQNGLGTWTVILPLGAGNPLVEIKLQGNGDVELLTTIGLEFNGRVIIS